jgi:prepilin-type N-terminal cleavage/methylation domain-containing protein
MNTEHKKGFTLIEMVVSIFIIVIAVVGILQVTSKYVQKTKFEKETYVAALLGQEAIEIVKNIRDNNWINSTTWNTGLADGDYEVDYDDTGLTSDSSRFLYIDSNGFYNYSTGTATIYKRKITLVNGTDKVSITVDVSWRGHTTTIKQDIYDWKQ